MTCHRGVDVEQRVALETAHLLEVCPRRPGSLAAGTAPVDDVRPARDSQGLVESAPLRAHCPAYQRAVSLRDLPRREAVGEETARLDRSRHEEQAGGLPVETVRQPNPFPPALVFQDANEIVPVTAPG